MALVLLVLHFRIIFVSSKVSSWKEKFQMNGWLGFEPLNNLWHSHQCTRSSQWLQPDPMQDLTLDSTRHYDNSYNDTSYNEQ